MEIIFTILFTTIILSLTLFQILLIVGLPLGEYAWGGQNKVLPKIFRVASVSSIIIYSLFLVIYFSKVGLLGFISNPTLVTTLFTVMTIYFGIGVIVNLVSRSKKERMVMTPVAAILFLLCLLGFF